MKTSADVVIIGGGIVGIACAFELRRRGVDVVVVERRPALGTLTTAASAASFRAQWEDATNIALMLEGIGFFERAGDILGLHDWEIGLRQQGYLFATAKPNGLERVKARVSAQRAAGLREAEVLDGDEARRRFPYLGPLVSAASFHPRDGWLDAGRLVAGYARAANATLVLETTVTGLQRDRSGVTAVTTTRGSIATRVAVVAAGPFSAPVAALAGVSLPLVCRWRQRIVLAPLAMVPPRAPMTIDADTGAHWRPEGGGALLAWADHDNDSPPSEELFLDRTFPGRVVRAVARLSPFWETCLDGAASRSETIRALLAVHTAGQYTITPDHNPLLGAYPALPGLHLACGFSGHGVMLAPAAARIVAAGIVEEARTNPFPAGRFLNASPAAHAEGMTL